jgi:hypothetical protein
MDGCDTEEGKGQGRQPIQRTKYLNKYGTGK